MTEIKVYLTTMFKSKPTTTPEVRLVEIPTDVKTATVEDILEDAFHYGQNEMQPQQKRSVTVGDIIELNDDLYVVDSFGFIKKGDKREIGYVLEFEIEEGHPMIKEHFGYLLEK